MGGLRGARASRIKVASMVRNVGKKRRNPRTKRKTPVSSSIPEALDFFKLIWRHEDACEEQTDNRLPNLGVKAPQCFAQLGTMLSLLDRLASCWWGCPGGHHVAQYLVGRGASTARAAIRLMRFGFYDEALGLVRNIGELANLLFLFAVDHKALPRWLSADRKTRLRKFTPAKVREELVNLGAPLVIDRDWYSRLSEISTHATPHTTPQAHNPFGIPTLGGNFQEAGVFVVLNELSLAIAMLAVAGSRVAKLENEERKVVRHESQKLIETIGGVTTSELPRYWERLRNQREFRELEAELKRQIAEWRRGSKNVKKSSLSAPVIN